MSVSNRLNANSEAALPPFILELHKRASVYGSYETTPCRHNASFDGIYLSAVQMESHAFLSGAQVRAYIKTVLMDQRFLAKPKKYVADWEARRTQQGYPQGPALEFFIKNRELL